MCPVNELRIWRWNMLILSFVKFNGGGVVVWFYSFQIMSLLNLTLNFELEFDSNLNIIVSLQVLSLLNLTLSFEHELYRTLPLVPKQVMISVKNVRNRGEVAAKYEILTVSSNLLVRRTRKTRRGTTRKLYPRAELVEDRRWSALTSGILKRIPAKMMV